MDTKKVISQWDLAAKSYAESQRMSPNNLTNNQIILDTLPDLAGKMVLDAGCGDGNLANIFKQSGANVFACDGSKELIKIAKHDFPGIDFKVCDLTQKLPYADAQFEIVVSSLVLMDMEHIDMFFKESRRVLKKDGKLVFTIVHPCFFHAPWEKDSNGNKLYKKLDNYWDQSTMTLDFWGATTHYHRPITWYSQILKRNGFAITQLKENPDDLVNFSAIKPHQRRIPLFLCFECCPI